MPLVYLIIQKSRLEGISILLVQLSIQGTTLG